MTLENQIAQIDLNVTRVQRLIIIRIEFNDYQFRNGEDVWSKKIFGYDDNELNSYPNEISYGAFKFKEANESYGTSDDGMITVQLDEDHPDPGNSGTEFLDELSDAIDKADSYIDFSDMM